LSLIHPVYYFATPQAIRSPPPPSGLGVSL
jgi:hypothetical protein